VFTDDILGPNDLEQLACEVRRIARLSDEELLLAPEIAGRVLGPRGVAFGPRGTVAFLDGVRIIVPIDHPDLNFAVAHELAEWALAYLARFGGGHVERERAANYVGAAIVAPASAVRRAHAHWGERLRTIAKAFALSQTCAALRLAEVRRDERAIITRSGHVLLRSQGAFPWGDVPVIRVARGVERWRGLTKARLRGGIDEGRIALRVT
jgi:hypothetical protein